MELRRVSNIYEHAYGKARGHWGDKKRLLELELSTLAAEQESKEGKPCGAGGSGPNQ